MNAGESPWDEHQQIRHKAQGFIFLGTPHKGARLTVVGKLLSLLGYWRGSSTSLLDILEPESIENKGLHRSFMKFLREDERLKKTLCVFEAVKESVFGIPLMHVCLSQDGGIVATPSLTFARFPGGRGVFGSDRWG